MLYPFGGASSLTLAKFRKLAAEDPGVEARRIILDGPQWGPSPWKNRSVSVMNGFAGEMIKAYVEAGFARLPFDGTQVRRPAPSAARSSPSAPQSAQVAWRSAPFCQPDQAAEPSIGCLIFAPTPQPKNRLHNSTRFTPSKRSVSNRLVTRVRRVTLAYPIDSRTH